MNMKIILASASPRRRELFENFGIDYEVMTSDAKEMAVAGEAPADTVRRLSREKAEAVSKNINCKDSLIVGADTVVAIDDTVLGKPKDDADAARMLRLLSGREHTVYTGFTVIRKSDGKMITDHESSAVRFRKLSDSEIEKYIKTGEPSDKAGAYGIQHYGSLLIEGIRGDYFNIVGLPVCRLAQVLKKEFGIELIV